MPWPMCESQGPALRAQFSPPTVMQVSGPEIRSKARSRGRDLYLRAVSLAHFSTVKALKKLSSETKTVF